MSCKIPFPPTILEVGWLGISMPLFVLLHCGNAWGACNPFQDIDIQNIDMKCPGGNQADGIYDNPAGTSISGMSNQIALCPSPTTTSVTWTFSQSTSNCTTDGTTNATCKDGGGSMTLSPPASPGLSAAQFSGTVPTGPAIFTVKVTDALGNSCQRKYDFNLNGTIGGWGDPHITTVDGVHYDFQSAGEFIALRGKGLEIQTRQTPVATTFLPGANPYTGLRTCVAIYSAVAARVGKYRVTYEPNISGVPDPSGMQLRVDGELTKLGSAGVNLGSDGRIVKSWTGAGSIEIDSSDGTQLIVTPAYWQDQQKWYLNVTVNGTKATEGIFGKLATGEQASWLPALPDGTSLGPKPESTHERYLELYGTFADAWRVTDRTSLFDYGPGTSTATFTLAGWPRENPESCAIPGQPSAKPVTVPVAQRFCAGIVDTNMKADCVFDVNVTGHTGFAKTYLVTQQLQPGATKTTVKVDRDSKGDDPKRRDSKDSRSKDYEGNVRFTSIVAPETSRGGSAPTGAVQFILDGRKVGDPISLDAKGKAMLSTSSLRAGQHLIAANYTPLGWGSLFTGSRSPAVRFRVRR